MRAMPSASLNRALVVARKLKGHGGLVRVVRSHLDALADLGIACELVSERIGADLASHCAVAGTRLVRRPWWPFTDRHAAFARRADALAAQVGDSLRIGHGDSSEVDVLVMHNCVHACNLAEHGRLPDPGDQVAQLHAGILTRQRFRLLIANSQMMADDLVQRWGIARERVRVVWPGYEPSSLPAVGARPAARAACGLPQDAWVLGLVTSGQLYKRGADVLIAAAAGSARFRARHGLLMVVAHGDDATWITGLAKQHGLTEHLRLVAPRSDVATLYACLDVAALPARYEEFGIAALEAMAAGLPTLLTRTVGAAELIPSDLRTELLAPGDVPALTAAIERCLDGGPWAAAWAARCQPLAQAQTAQRSGRAWAEAFAPLVGSR